MTNGFIVIEGEQLAYCKIGKGEQLLFAFHGFDEDGSKFSILKSSLSKKYTVIAIDLPFHGDTKWHENVLLTPALLKQLAEQLLKQFNKEHFSLIGYSLGGKLVMSLIAELPSKIDAVFLIASDGIKNNVWYNVSTYPAFGRALFRLFIMIPYPFLWLLKVLNLLSIINDDTMKIVKMRSETAQKRQKVYNTWLCLRELDQDINAIKQKINTHHIKVNLIFGKYDPVIKPAFGNFFAKGLNNCKLIILDKGHNLMKDYLNETISALLSK